MRGTSFLWIFWNHVSKVVKWRKFLGHTWFITADGVAPRAKMNQQRSRRFRAAKDAADAVCFSRSLHLLFEVSGRIICFEAVTYICLFCCCCKSLVICGIHLSIFYSFRVRVSISDASKVSAFCWTCPKLCWRGFRKQRRKGCGGSLRQRAI